MNRNVIVACCLLLGACASTAPAGRPAAELDAPAAPVRAPADLAAYQLGIGDRVRVDVFGESDLSIDATVDPTGHISYPFLGSLVALRKTAKELQDAITAGLANGFLVNPDVRVTVLSYRPFYVTGQVKKAGAYPFAIGLTVEKALALAGGLTPLASTRRIYLVREDAADQRLRVGLDALVFPGDTVVVEEGLF